jgi:hypothetical protein
MLKRKESKVHECRISDQIFKIDIFNISKIERIVYKKARRRGIEDTRQSVEKGQKHQK